MLWNTIQIILSIMYCNAVQYILIYCVLKCNCIVCILFYCLVIQHEDLLKGQVLIKYVPYNE